jgi:glucokinase
MRTRPPATDHPPEREVGFERALLINDFAALALAVDLLDEKHLHTIGPRMNGLEGETTTILGAGTGFGVSCLARHGDHVGAVGNGGRPHELCSGHRRRSCGATADVEAGGARLG